MLITIPDCIKWARGKYRNIELWQKAAFYVPSLIVNRNGHGYLEKFELCNMYLGNY